MISFVVFLPFFSPSDAENLLMFFLLFFGVSDHYFAQEHLARERAMRAQLMELEQLVASHGSSDVCFGFRPPTFRTRVWEKFLVF